MSFIGIDLMHYDRMKPYLSVNGELDTESLLVVRTTASSRLANF